MGEARRSASCCWQATTSQRGRGGHFVRGWDGRKPSSERLTSGRSGRGRRRRRDAARRTRGLGENVAHGRLRQSRHGPGPLEGDSLRFRLCPRVARVWSYTIKSDLGGINGHSRAGYGRVGVARAHEPSVNAHPNWWTDDPDPAAAEGIHAGAKSVNRCDVVAS